MYDDKRTIQDNGLLTPKQQTYRPGLISMKLGNTANKPDAGHINIDQDKALADYRYEQQLALGQQQFQQSQQQSAAQFQQQQANAGGSVICTELKRLGIMSQELYEQAHLGRPVNQCVLNGYHLWAVPYVESMRNWSLPRLIAKPLALAWAYHRAHKLAPDQYPKESLLGLSVHVIGGTICWTIGLFIPVKVNWQSLYTGRNSGYPWPTQ
ncbi:MAG: hypothetical protein WC856_07705 [Methylococcaceae bacterium]|jgi:hypothetical protein